MPVENCTALHLTVALGEAIGPTGLPRRSSIHTNGAHSAWNGVGGTHATPSHQCGCIGDNVRPMRDPKHPRLMPSQVRFRRGHLPAAFNHQKQQVSCWQRFYSCCLAQCCLVSISCSSFPSSQLNCIGFLPTWVVSQWKRVSLINLIKVAFFRILCEE